MICDTAPPPGEAGQFLSFGRPVLFLIIKNFNIYYQFIFIKLLQIKKDLLPKNTKLKYVIKRDGGIYNKDGLDIDEIIKYTSSNNKIQNHPLWSDISFEDILKNKDVDILIELTSTNIINGIPHRKPSTASKNSAIKAPPL